MASRTVRKPTITAAPASQTPRFRGTVEMEFPQNPDITSYDFGGQTFTGIECQIDLSGRDAALYQWDHTGERFKRIDRLRGVVIEFNKDSVVIRGTSDKLLSHLNRYSAEECMAVITLYPSGCQDCD
jgi:hypothetical protein